MQRKLNQKQPRKDDQGERVKVREQGAALLRKQETAQLTVKNGQLKGDREVGGDQVQVVHGVSEVSRSTSCAQDTRAVPHSVLNAKKRSMNGKTIWLPSHSYFIYGFGSVECGGCLVRRDQGLALDSVGVLRSHHHAGEI